MSRGKRDIGHEPGSDDIRRGPVLPPNERQIALWAKAKTGRGNDYGARSAAYWHKSVSGSAE